MGIVVAIVASGLLVACGGGSPSPIDPAAVAPTVIAVKGTATAPSASSELTAEDEWQDPLPAVTEEVPDVFDGAPELAATPLPAPVSEAAPVSASPRAQVIAPAAPPQWSVAVTPSTSRVSSGKTITFTATLENLTDAVVAVKFEVYNARGVKVYESASSNMFVAAGQHRISRPWTVPSGTAPGRYTIAFGVFARGWEGVLNWLNPAGTFDVFVD